MFHVVTKCWRQHKLATTAVSRVASEKAIDFRHTSAAKPADRRTQASEQSELISKQVLYVCMYEFLSKKKTQKTQKCVGSDVI